MAEAGKDHILAALMKSFAECLMFRILFLIRAANIRNKNNFTKFAKFEILIN